MKKLKSISAFFILLIFALAFTNCENENYKLEANQLNLEKINSDFETFVEKISPEIKHIVEENDLRSKDFNINSKTDLKLNEKLSILVDESKKVLLANGVLEKDILEEFGDLNDKRIAIAGLGVFTFLKYKKINKNNQYRVEGDAVNCALEALGLNIGISSLHELGEVGVKKFAKNLLKTAGKRLLGPIGVAIMVAEFAYCMH